MTSGPSERLRRKRAARGLKISELVQRSETSRETIHYYTRSGLLHPPQKTSRNMAYYDDSHVERLLAIKRLRSESYLPLSVIKQLIEKGDLGASVRRADVAGELMGSKTELQPVSAEELARRSGAPMELLEAAQRLGIIRPQTTPDGPRFGIFDLRIAEVLASTTEEVRTTQPDWILERFEIFERHIRNAVEEEVVHFFRRTLAGEDPEPANELLKGGRETIGRYLALSRARALTESMEEIFETVATTLGEASPPVLNLSPHRTQPLRHALDESLARFQSGPSGPVLTQLLLHALALGRPDLVTDLNVSSLPPDPGWELPWAEALLEDRKFTGALASVERMTSDAPLKLAIRGSARLGRLQTAFAKGRTELLSWAKSGEIFRELLGGLADLRKAHALSSKEDDASVTRLRCLFLLARVEELCPPFLDLGARARADYEELYRRATESTPEDVLSKSALDRFALNAAAALARVGAGGSSESWRARASALEPEPVEWAPRGETTP